MKRSYNIKKLNPRKNPYIGRIGTHPKIILDEDQETEAHRKTVSAAVQETAKGAQTE